MRGANYRKPGKVDLEPTHITVELQYEVVLDSCSEDGMHKRVEDMTNVRGSHVWFCSAQVDGEHTLIRQNCSYGDAEFEFVQATKGSNA